MENEFIKVEAAGALINLTDKETGKTYRNLNLLEEEADAGDAWDYSPPWTPGETVLSSRFPFACRLAEDGPVRKTLEVSGAMDVPERLVGDARSSVRVFLKTAFRISLYTGIKRVDVRLALTNAAKDHRVSLKVPLSVRTDEIISQSHLAVIKRPVTRERPTEEWVQPHTQILPFREWVAAEDGTHGLAVAAKGIYDYEANVNPLNLEPELRLTLLRGIQIMGRKNMLQRKGAASDAVETPGAQCPGDCEIEWSYLPYSVHKGDIAPFLPAAQSFLYPPVAHAVRPAGGATKEDTDFALSDVSWNAANMQFSAFKQAHCGQGYVLRLYENQGIPTEVKIKVGSFKKARLAGLDEAPVRDLTVADGAVTIEAGPYKAVTVLLD